MGAKYWIKLWHEVLDDYKMGTLPDTLWRRTVEIFLYAGERDQDGLLPGIEEMAYRMRVNPKQLAEEVEELIQVGILTREDDKLFVTNFAKRQAATSDAERKKFQRQRDRSQSQDGHEPVTNCDTDTDTDTDKDTDTESDTEPESSVVVVRKLYEQEIGIITPIILTGITEAVEAYPLDWIQEAVGIAVEKNARNWRYIAGTLKNWQAEGRHKKGRQTAAMSQADKLRQSYQRNVGGLG